PSGLRDRPAKTEACESWPLGSNPSSTAHALIAQRKSFGLRNRKSGGRISLGALRGCNSARSEVRPDESGVEGSNPSAPTCLKHSQKYAEIVAKKSCYPGTTQGF